MSINRVAVLGAGVMGSGIAAQVANAGFEVILLDIVPDGANDRNVIAAGAVDKMLKTKPAPFMDPKNARRISTGNLEDDLGMLAEADWIIEAVIERLDVRGPYSEQDGVAAGKNLRKAVALLVLRGIRTCQHFRLAAVRRNAH